MKTTIEDQKRSAEDDDAGSGTITKLADAAVSKELKQALAVGRMGTVLISLNRQKRRQIFTGSAAAFCFCSVNSGCFKQTTHHL